MVENSSPQKNDEQHPLLKVESGGGDSGRPPSVVAPGYVTCTPKRSWTDRWPELVSAFWLSGMFLGIFCLIIWGLVGCGVIRRPHVLMLHCNSSRPGSEVYYHHIVQRGSSIPFTQFSEYLSNMASLYSSLRFNVIFLIDDTVQSNYRGLRHNKFFNKMLPYHPYIGDYKFDETNEQELKDFHLKYQNVNVTIMPLSKYMGMTPLRFKWRSIPMAYLTFYARVFSVWQTGGIGIDLNSFSTQLNLRQLPDRRISAILKQHNNGIKPEEYTNTLNNIDREEQNEFISLFYGIVHQILNETRAFFNRTLSYSQDFIEKDIIMSTSEPLIRTHRHKRELGGTETKSILNSTEKGSTTKEISVINTMNETVVDAVFKNKPFVTAAETADEELNTNLEYQHETQRKQNKTEAFFKSWNKNISEPPQILLVYDFSLLSDNSMGPSYLLPEALVQANSPVQPIAETVPASGNHAKKPSLILSINAEGTFIAASQKQHPFLYNIISSGCQRMPPRFAIQNAIISQCSHMFRDDLYCRNIHLLQ